MSREARESARERMREAFGGIDFVSREEFDTVKAMAQKAREQAEELRKQGQTMVDEYKELAEQAKNTLLNADARTKAEQTLQAWATAHGLRWVAGVRATQGYVRCIEQGLTIFDLPAARNEADLAQWQPVTDWLQAAWADAARAELESRVNAKPTAVGVSGRFADGSQPSKPAAPRPAPPPLEAPPVRATLQGAPPRGLAGRLGWLLNAFRSN